MHDLRRKIWDCIGYFMHSGQKIYSQYNPQIAENFILEDSNGNQVVLNQNRDILTFQQITGNLQFDAEKCKFANLLLKKQNFRMGLMALGRNKKYYDLSNLKKITKNEGNLLIFSGVLSSVLPYESGLLVNFDLSTRIIREKSLWTEMCEALNGNYTASDFENYIQEKIIGRSFMVSHSNDRFVRVDAVDSKTKVTSAFPNPKFKNFVDYYAKRHLFALRDPEQIMCVCIEKDYQFNRKGIDKHQEVFSDRRGEYIK